jgi:hypothetical protein
VGRRRKGIALKPLTQQQIRSSMTNCSRGEASRMMLPAAFAGIDWPNLEDLGWRDPKAPQRGYLVLPLDDRLTGVALRAPEGTTNKTVMCTLCRTTHSGGGVALFVARRGGAAGRNDNTVGTYICADLACPKYIRLTRATAAIAPEPGKDVEARAAGLIDRTSAFIDRVLG